MKQLNLILFILTLCTTAFSSEWVVDSPWDKKKGSKNFETFLSSNVKDLNCKEGSSLRFPNIMHSTQTVYLDEKVISLFGHDKLLTTQSIYGAPTIPCEAIMHGQVLTWAIHTPIQYFAKIRSYPTVSSNNSPIHFSDITNMSIVAALIVFIILLLSGPKNSLLYKQSVRLSIFSFFMVGFYVSSVTGHIGLNIDYLVIDKIACVFLGLATLAFIEFLSSRNLFSKKVATFLSVISFAGTLPIPFLNDGDTIQSFLNVIFGPAVIAVWIPFFPLLKNFNIKKTKSFNLQYTALACFAAATTSDILYTAGIHNFGFTLGYGVLGTVLFFTGAIQSDINNTYRLLEHLQKNLENEVKVKTTELTLALENLKSTQAELIQQEKMASLGTLSAGIAHEINNSINYVNACLDGLRKKIFKIVPEDSPDLKKIEALLDTIKHGTKVTIDIVSSLRNYTGLNQAKMKSVLFEDIVESVTTIAKSKIKDTEIIKDYDPSLEIYCSVVGISQVLMNLLTNALDAIEDQENKKITIGAAKDNSGIKISFQDNGPGMPETILKNVFDPFFTTKDVGKGTGLGLFIVRKEVEEIHHGKISFETNSDGTKFTAFIPQHEESSITREAA